MTFWHAYLHFEHTNQIECTIKTLMTQGSFVETDLQITLYNQGHILQPSYIYGCE